MPISAESLAFDCELECDMCGQSVNLGDDYLAHLKIVHGIKKNFAFFEQRAQNKIKAGKRKADLITLDEDDGDDVVNDIDGSIEDVEDTGGHDEALEPKSEDDTQLDDDVKQKMKMAAQNIMEELLSPIRNLLDGKVPLDDVTISAAAVDEDPAAAEQRIWDSFEKLKMTINKMEVPKEVMQSFMNSGKESDQSLQENVETENNFKHPSSPPQPPKRKVSRPTVPEQSEAEAVTGPSPSKSVRSDKSGGGVSVSGVSGSSSRSSSSSSGSRRVTMFCCPLDNCDFTVDRAGMETLGLGAKHLKMKHKVTSESMKEKPKGFYKFKKVKKERS